MKPRINSGVPASVICVSGWQWFLRNPDELNLTLFSPKGRPAATVFLTRDLTGNIWFIWDEQGTGGENDCESDIAEGMRQSELALIRSGWHGLAAIYPVMRLAATR